MTATACGIVFCQLTSDITIEDMHLGTVAYMSVLTAAIDRTLDGGAIGRNVVSRGTTNIDNGLIDIAHEEVGHIPVAWRNRTTCSGLTTTAAKHRAIGHAISIYKGIST